MMMNTFYFSPPAITGIENYKKKMFYIPGICLMKWLILNDSNHKRIGFL